MSRVTLPAEEYDRKSKIEENFRVLKKFNDARYGPVTIIEVPGNNRKIMCKEKIFNSKIDLTNEIYAVKKRVGLSNPNLLNFVDYSTGSRSDFCSTFWWIKLFFEFPDHDLDQELKRRARFNIAGLTSDELTHMMYQCCDAGAFLNANQMMHGDICPETIEMDNPERYRLVEKFGDLSRPDDVQQAKIYSGAEVYAAPEIYSRLVQGYKRAPSKVINLPAGHEKSDVFSLGLTMLQAGNDQSVQGIYNKAGTINQDVLERQKQAFVNKFGMDNNLLVTTVMSMLEMNPEARPDFRTIMSQIPPYSEVKSFLDQEKIRPTHNSAVQTASSNFAPPPFQSGDSMYSTHLNQGNPNAIYQNYVKSNTWETEWGNPALPGQRPVNTTPGALDSNLALPRPPVQGVPGTTVSGLQPGTATSQFGVAPTQGMLNTNQGGFARPGIPGTTTTQTTTTVSGLQPGIATSQFGPATTTSGLYNSQQAGVQGGYNTGGFAGRPAVGGFGPTATTTTTGAPGAYNSVSSYAAGVNNQGRIGAF